MIKPRADYLLTRFSSQADSTLGILSVAGGSPRGFLCFTLEDEHREEKVPGETRIPAGTYRILLRNAGGMHAKYSERYEFHQGMLHLQDVPNFEWIYIHTGNTDDHTEGCILLGDSCSQNISQNGFVGKSVAAYERIYPDMARLINTGVEVYLTIIDQG